MFLCRILRKTSIWLISPGTPLKFCKQMCLRRLYLTKLRPNVWFCVEYHRIHIDRRATTYERFRLFTFVVQNSKKVLIINITVMFVKLVLELVSKSYWIPGLIFNMQSCQIKNILWNNKTLLQIHKKFPNFVISVSVMDRRRRPPNTKVSWTTVTHILN